MTPEDVIKGLETLRDLFAHGYFIGHSHYDKYAAVLDAALARLRTPPDHFCIRCHHRWTDADAQGQLLEYCGDCHRACQALARTPPPEERHASALAHALSYHKSDDGEGEYGCPGATCPGVKRLTKFLLSWQPGPEAPPPGLTAWQPVETAPRDNSAFRAYSPDLVHPDFNPWGQVEACFDGDQFIGAVWDGQFDVWQTVPITFTHWQPFPWSPLPASPSSPEELT